MTLEVSVGNGREKEQTGLLTPEEYDCSSSKAVWRHASTASAVPSADTPTQHAPG